MREVGSYEAKTHFPRLVRLVEEGETVTITRHGKPVAQLGPVAESTRADVQNVIRRMKEARARRQSVSVREIISAKDEGRKV